MNRTPDKTEQDRDVMRLRYALDSIRPYLQAVCEHRVGIYRGDSAATLLDRVNRALDGRPTAWDVEQGHVSKLEGSPNTSSGGLKYDAKRIANTRATTTADALTLDALDLRDALDDIEELHQRVRDALDAAASREAYLTSAPSPPVPMILTCPSCGARHVDVGEFATKPHHTHACQRCGMVWRPALVDTVGVQFLPGYKNEEPTAPPSIVWRREVWSPGMCPGHPDPHAASGDGAQVEKEAAANVAADHYLPGDQLKIPRRLGETGDRTWTRWLLIQHDKGSIWVAKRMADDGTVERHRTSGVDVRYAGRRLPTVPVKH